MVELGERILLKIKEKSEEMQTIQTETKSGEKRNHVLVCILQFNRTTPNSKSSMPVRIFPSLFVRVEASNSIKEHVYTFKKAERCF